ncbi:iron complex outermembrane receptor protein [Anseongella ginsenosidimutans]|uniref:Iron complex outermembrane receptor protein n=1 Tax=Anseongella ginsenosidimutans TaxID=496056 RepID=A0A4R3KPB4_9SPHI|nr:TonB-dependent receptor [Anseongella ginsenosidimutans]QEC52564.1 TonB-dependent receptor [Anseongella ginsenosidimutans]TCS86480.1 iron complex outermembrane receptor protein [Anseongella ginsenosidimutans]
MKRLILLSAMLFSIVSSYAQNTYKAIVKDAETDEPLPGATVTVQGTGLGAASDHGGNLLLENIPDGEQVIFFSYLGYQPLSDTVIFPFDQPSPALISLVPAEHGDDHELEEVVITATRSSRTIDNIPTRVEVIAGEELDEKGNMKPGDIRMLLAESTGIQTQQTSATSGNSSIRIQGLDGKYTQMIRDGFPLYSGFSGGLGLLQIAPLDLQQVEVIKGSSSTLYGGGAIAGLVNLVSKKPAEERQLNLLLNGTSALGLDANAFYAEKFKKTGTTIYAAYNHGSAYDPSDIGLTAIPEFDRFTLNPKIYLYFTDRTTLYAGINATVEKRVGGDLEYVKGNGSPGHTYFEENKTGRYSTQIELDHELNSREKLVFRNSAGYYDRSIGMPDYKFSGGQLSTYTEANYSRKGDNADWVAGVNFVTDHFKEDKAENTALRDYQYHTIGGFIQNTWNTSGKFTVESGLRGDYHNNYGFFFLPRVSALWKVNEHFSTRLGGGMGYKAPTVFTEDAERVQFRNVLPLDVKNTEAERSYGASYDINFRTGLFGDKGSFSINQLFFYTRINDPILLTQVENGSLAYLQPEGYLNTRGIETNAKITYGDFKLFIGYTLADVDQHTGGKTMSYPLVSKHRLNNVLMYEVEEEWKIGLEAYYFGKQTLNDGTSGKSYWVAGLMLEKLWEGFSIFLNFENLTDTRQAGFGTIYTGDITNPAFNDIYAPMDGFVINGGIKLRL